ncbi:MULTISPECIES: hypothetical protein [unclassified Streptomyces]|uniref:hypothetical protein n=1 Tax=unclassified Streptomyces TaxID=2593676 RepID=UPI0011B0599D|nr:MULTISPECIES: hypothetical protein [unclassified Streptomyces]
MKRFTQHPLTGVSDATTGRIPGFGTASANEMVRINETLWKSHEEQRGKDAAEAAQRVTHYTTKAIQDAYMKVGNIAYGPSITGEDYRAIQGETKMKAINGFNDAKSSDEYWKYK